MRITTEGEVRFMKSYDRKFSELASHGLFAEQRPYRMAYLIHLLDYMIQSEVEVHCVRVPR